MKIIIQTIKGLFSRFLIGLKACLTGFVASSRASLGLLVWAVFVGIIYATIGLEDEGC